MRALSSLALVASVVFGADLAAQDLAARSLIVYQSTIPRGTRFTFRTTHQNVGLTNVGLHYVGVYVSTDSVITTSDRLVNARGVSSLLRGRYYYFSSASTMPSTMPIGRRYVGFIADYRNQIRETNEANNRLARPVNVIAGPADKPDLTIASLVPSATRVYPTVGFSVATVVRNAGIGTAGSSVTGFYLSKDSTITDADPRLAQVGTPGLLGGRSYSLRPTLRIPTTFAPGTYYIGAYADRSGAVAESNEANNGRGVPITVLGRSEVRADALTLDRSTQVAGGFLSATYRVSNQGNLTTPRFHVDLLLDGSSSVPRGQSLILARIPIAPLAPRAIKSDTVRVQLPFYPIPSSSYRIMLMADSKYEVTELSESNNVQVKTLSLAEYRGSALQLEFAARRDTRARDVRRLEVTMSGATGGSVGMALKSRPLAGHWVLTSWGFTKAFAFDAATALSLSMLNSPVFPLWFTRLDANGRAFPGFNLPKTTLGGTLVLYGRTYALKPDFSGISGQAGFVRFNLIR